MTEPDDLRKRYAEALAAPLPCLVCERTERCRCARPKDAPSTAERRADLLLAVRDEELKQLQIIEIASIGAHALLADAEQELETARAAIARVRALHPDDHGLCGGCTNAVGVPSPCDTTRALDQPATTTGGA